MEFLGGFMIITITIYIIGEIINDINKGPKNPTKY
jgi:hypothetical protein